MSRTAQLIAASLAAVLLLAGATATSRAACPEVSAPGSGTPLLVERAAGGALGLRWEAAGGDEVWIQAGSLQALAAGGWDHVGLASTTDAAFELDAPAGGVYFLVQRACDGEAGSAGEESDGTPRPVARRVSVGLGVEGGTGIFGVHAGVDLPPGAFVVPGSVEARGPYAASGPARPWEGYRLLSFGGDPDRPEGLLSFTFFSPDPGFTAGAAVEVLRFEAAFLGPVPTPEELLVVPCDVRNAATEMVPGATCRVTTLEEMAD